MASTRRLSQLSTVIQQNTTKIDAYLESSGHPEPSFEASYPPVLDLPPEADAARKAALEALDELRDHLLGPLGMITTAATELATLVSMHGMVRFQLAENLPTESTISIPELAHKSGMHPEDAEMIVRHGIPRRLFLQHEDGKIGHSAASKAMLAVPNIASFVEAVLDNMWSSAPSVVTAMQKWPGSQEPTQTAYNLAHHQTDLSFFQGLAQHETRAQKFAEAMTFMQSAPELGLDYVLEYDWSQHANGTVVDVGGSQGVVAFKLAEAYPNMTIIVQDRPEVIATVASGPQTAAAGAHKNVHFQAHDFFSPQPVADADVYFFRWILHDWPTKYCIRILRALIPALNSKPGARIVLMDAILPEPGQLTPFQERGIRNFDVVMKTLFNARERSESDWRKLVAGADEGGRFKVRDVVRPVGSQLGFLVIEWTG